MSEKKELNNEELEKVNGGSWGDEMSEHLPSTHGAHIGMNYVKNHIGEKVYVVLDSNNTLFAWGTVFDSRLNTLGVLCHEITIEDMSSPAIGFIKGNTEILPANSYTVFLFN